MECILPFGMLCLSAWIMKFVKMVFAVCMSGGGRMSEKTASVSVMNCVQFAFLSFVNVCLFFCGLYLVRVVIVVIMGRWSEFSAYIVCQVVRLYSVVENVVMFGEVCAALWWVCWCLV